MRTGSGLTFLFGDQLGSTSVTYRLNDGQTILQLYRPWGEVRYSSGSLPTQYQYTGQYTYAADFGLYFYNARWYDSQISRFNEPDSLITDPGNTQTWDRYAYVNNNPLIYIDPSGNKPCIDNDKNGQCVVDLDWQTWHSRSESTQSNKGGKPLQTPIKGHELSSYEFNLLILAIYAE